MAQVSIHDAKTHLSKLLRQVEAGEEITISRGQKSIARLVPIQSAKTPRKPGSLKGFIDVPDSFFDPLTDDELELWEGR